MRTTLQQRIADCRKKEVYGLRANIQAIFRRRRHQPRRPPLAKIRPGRPAPAMGPGTLTTPFATPGLSRMEY
jgi:hypothetical protein